MNGGNNMLDPKLTESQLNKGSFFQIYDNEAFELEAIISEKEVIEAQTIDHPILYKSIFRGAVFSANDFQRFEATDCIFEDCDFSGNVLIKSMLHRVQFINCKFTGTKFTESYIGNTLFSQSKMDYSNFSDSKIKESAFEAVNLSGSDFVECVLTKTRFANSNLNEVSFFDTNLKNIDLSSNAFENIEIRQEHLKNCVFNQYQAILLARKFLQIRID